MDVADGEAGGDADGVVDQLGSFRRLRHLQPRAVELLWRIVGAQTPLGLGMEAELDAERLGDAGRGDVVVGRADAAGGEDVVVLRPAGVDRLDDVGLGIRHDAHLAHLDAGLVQRLGEEGEVRVLGAAGQDLVADDDQCRRDRPFAHAVLPSCRLDIARAHNLPIAIGCLRCYQLRVECARLLEVEVAARRGRGSVGGGGAGPGAGRGRGGVRGRGRHLPHRELIKSQGGRWSGSRRRWLFRFDAAGAPSRFARTSRGRGRSRRGQCRQLSGLGQQALSRPSRAIAQALPGRWCRSRRRL